MSYIWSKLKNLLVNKSAAKNLFIAGSYPLDNLPNDLLICIYHRLDYKSQINWGRTSKQFYPYKIETIRNCCFSYNNLAILSHYDYSVICKIVKPWTEKEILSAVEFLVHSRNYTRLYILSAIYQSTKNRKFWSLLNMTQNYPNFYIRRGDTNSFNKALVSFSRFGYFLYQNFETGLVYSLLYMALREIFTDNRLTRQKLIMIQKNLRQVLNREKANIVYYEELMNWYQPIAAIVASWDH